MADPNPGIPAALPDSLPERPGTPALPAAATPKRGRGRPPKPDHLKLGRVIQVRIDGVLQTAIRDYMAMNNMTVSQALRVLITVGLDQERANPDAVFHAAAFREGILQGLGHVRGVIQRSVNIALNEIEQEIQTSEEEATDGSP